MKIISAPMRPMVTLPAIAKFAQNAKQPTTQLPSYGNSLATLENQQLKKRYQFNRRLAEHKPTLYPNFQPTANTMAAIYARPRPQFNIGHKLSFRDKRTGEQKDTVEEKSIPQQFKYFLPDIYRSERPLLVLDMDLTLVYTRIGTIRPVDIQMTLSQGSTRVSYSVILRPYLQPFLEQMSLIYDLMIFTSAGQLYADNLIDRFDKSKLIQYRVFQQHCTQITEGGLPVFVKDLSRIGQSLDRMIIVDDNPRSIQFQTENSVLIKAFDGSRSDDELYRLSARLQRVYEEWKVGGSVIRGLALTK